MFRRALFTLPSPAQLLRTDSGAEDHRSENTYPLNPSDSYLDAPVSELVLCLHAGPRGAPWLRLLAPRSERRTLAAGASPTLEPWGGQLRTSGRETLHM